jgi:adenine/guanine phosphoribosyltransferase-like PRPP-binding protein
VAAKAAPRDGRSSQSMQWCSTVEEGDDLLEWRRSKEVAVVDDVVARGRQLTAGGTVA